LFQVDPASSQDFWALMQSARVFPGAENHPNLLTLIRKEALSRASKTLFNLSLPKPFEKSHLQNHQEK